ncbi:ZNF784 isoform 2 [Pan troglodytes]|uniref:ZNF784 isoform 2 n=1 Tax=Pan troglodytes TaxID=9598 RepID=A0A2J8IWN9_PANTR|nr:ZNF784 isoform 2 [Pan troglodytes]
MAAARPEAQSPSSPTPESRSQEPLDLVRARKGPGRGARGPGA